MSLWRFAAVHQYHRSTARRRRRSFSCCSFTWSRENHLDCGIFSIGENAFCDCMHTLWNKTSRPPGARTKTNTRSSGAQKYVRRRRGGGKREHATEQSKHGTSTEAAAGGAWYAACSNMSQRTLTEIVFRTAFAELPARGSWCIARSNQPSTSQLVPSSSWASSALSCETEPHTERQK